jgi:hypothetical protein
MSVVSAMQNDKNGADLCAVCASVMLRDSPAHRHMCEICAEVCDACAESCEQFAGDAAMIDCARECRRCAESCRAMARGLHA